jgi:prepilin-type N-terminal cleavage/methylation domain-containing protein
MMICRPKARCIGARPPRSAASGFTLIELMVSMGIMLFVVTLTVIAFAPAFGASGMRGAARTISAALDGARIRAIQQQRLVRFEAQRTPGIQKLQWRVTGSAGDVNQEWKALSEFLAVTTNVAETPGTSGTNEPFTEGNERISISFGPDGSVARVAWGTSATGDLTSDYEGDELTGPFALRVKSTRDSAGDSAAYIVITPLTGAITTPEAE